MSFLSQCVFKTTDNGKLISGFPVSELTTDDRFNGLIVPLGLYSSNLLPTNPSILNNNQNKKITLIDDTIFNHLFSSISKQKKTRNITHKRGELNNNLHKTKKHYK
jgi:hypothetical protein